jgi:hypothetical protein
LFLAMASAATQQTVPSFMRTVPGSVNIPIARFPSSAASSSDDAELLNVASELVSKFNQLLEAKDYAGLSRLFVEDGYWRDHLALTWRFRTIHTPAKIENFLKSCAADSQGGGFKLTKLAVDATNSVRKPQIKKIDGSDGSVSVLRSFITFESTVGSGDGVINLAKGSDGTWRIFFLYTRLDELDKHEEATYERRPQGVQHGGHPDRKNWSERRQAESDFEDGKGPTVVIIGTSCRRRGSP